MNDQQFQLFLQKLEQSIASVTPEESQAKSLGLIFKDALAEQGESWKSELQQQKDEKDKLIKDFAELKASFDISKKELDEIKAEAQVKAAADIFNARMNFLEETFSFSDKELQFVTAEVKELGADEGDFEFYKGKVNVMFSHKLKEAIASQEAEVAARIEEEVAKRLQTSTATDTEAKCAEDKAKAEAEAKCAADKAKAAEKCAEEEEDLETEKAKASLANNNQSSSINQTLAEKMKQNFSVEITL